MGPRAHLHAVGAKRPLSDPMMLLSHAGFFLSAPLAASRGLLDLAVLTSITTLLSLLYHWSYEKPGSLCFAESIVAKCLFAYGAAQIYYIPNALPWTFLAAEVACLIVTVAVFLYTNVVKDSYDDLHYLMHLVPGLWCGIVAAWHRPLLRITLGGI